MVSVIDRIQCSKRIEKIYDDELLVSYLKEHQIVCIDCIQLSLLQQFFVVYKYGIEKKQRILKIFFNRKEDNNKNFCLRQCQNFARRMEEKSFNIDFLNQFDHYRCTARINLMTIDLLSAIVTYFLDNEKEEIIFEHLYVYLCNHFQTPYLNKTELKNFFLPYLAKDIYKTINKKEFFQHYHSRLRGEIVVTFSQIQQQYGWRYLSNLVKTGSEDFIKEANNYSSLHLHAYPLTKEEIETYLSLFHQLYPRNELFAQLHFPDLFQKILIDFDQRYQDANSLEEKAKDIEKKIALISESNKKYPVKYLASSALNDFFQEMKIKIVGDLIKLSLKKINNNISEELATFLNCIMEDLREQVVLELESIIASTTGNDKKNIVISERTKNATLDSVGKTLQITSERVRQIEAEIISDFRNLILNDKGEMFLKQLITILENPLRFNVKKLETIFFDRTPILLYLINKSETPHLKCMANFVCLTEDETLMKAQEIIEFFPVYLLEEDLSKYVLQMENELLDKNISEQELRELMLYKYRKNGKVFEKGMQGKLRDKYSFIVEKFFPDGIKIYAKEEIDKFKKHYIEIFNDETINNKNNRSIGATIEYNCIYISPGLFAANSKAK